MRKFVGSASRRGFGTTTSFVLVIIGIALLILLGGDMLSRGSRVSIERAYITGQLLRIANMAIEEAMTSEAGREQLADSMLKGVAQSGSVPPKTDTAGRNTLILGFLDAIVPTNNGTMVDVFANTEEATIQHKYPWDTGPATPLKFWKDTGRVIFGIDASKNAKYPAATLTQAYKQEIDGGIVKIEPVEVRVVAFRAFVTDAAPPSVGKVRMPFTANRRMGVGLARARVQVGWLLPRHVEGKAYTIKRTVTSDRFFELKAPKNILGTGADAEWQLVAAGEWQREAIGA